MNYQLCTAQALSTAALTALCLPALAQVAGDEYKYGLPAQSAQTPHCVLELQRVNGSQSFQPGAQRCYETLAESIADLTDGNVLLPVNIAGAELEDYDDAYQAWTHGEIYEDPFFGGASYLIKNPLFAKCSDGVGYYEIDVMPSGWNDRVSSARASKKNECLIKLWEHGHLTGYSTPYFRKRETLDSAIDNKTSSMSLVDR